MPNLIDTTPVPSTTPRIVVSDYALSQIQRQLADTMDSVLKFCNRFFAVQDMPAGSPPSTPELTIKGGLSISTRPRFPIAQYVVGASQINGTIAAFPPGQAGTAIPYVVSAPFGTSFAAISMAWVYNAPVAGSVTVRTVPTSETLTLPYTSAVVSKSFTPDKYPIPANVTAYALVNSTGWSQPGVTNSGVTVTLWAYL